MKNRSSFPVAVSVSDDPSAHSAVTFIPIDPSPNGNPDLIVTDSPGAILEIVSAAEAPRSTVPSNVILQSTSVASASPVFSITALTPIPPVIPPIFRIGFGVAPAPSVYTPLFPPLSSVQIA